MALSKISFSKNWTNPDDFPTYEGTESKVREDMQLLHDETKEFINNTLTTELDAVQSNNVATFATKAALDAVVAGISPEITDTVAALKLM